MAHFAKIDDNNLVIASTIVADSDCNNGDEAAGVAFLTNLTGWSKWKKYDPDSPLCQIGGTWVPETGEFKPKSPIENGVWDDTEKRWKDPADGDLKPTDPI